MATFDDAMKDLDETRPQDLHEDELPKVDGAYELDEEDIEDLMLDCHIFIGSLLEIKTSKWVQSDAIALRDRLDEMLSWKRMH